MADSAKRKLKTCSEGHAFYKSSDCLVCPICEATNKPKSGFLSKLGSPARRALQNEGITTLTKLSEYTEIELLKLHGLGPSSIPILKISLKEAGLSFKKK